MFNSTELLNWLAIAVLAWIEYTPRSLFIVHGNEDAMNHEPLTMNKKQVPVFHLSENRYRKLTC